MNEWFACLFVFVEAMVKHYQIPNTDGRWPMADGTESSHGDAACGLLPTMLQIKMHAYRAFASFGDIRSFASTWKERSQDFL